MVAEASAYLEKLSRLTVLSPSKRRKCRVLTSRMYFCCSRLGVHNLSWAGLTTVNMPAASETDVRAQASTMIMRTELLTIVYILK